MTYIRFSADKAGAFISTLCMVHCAITPFLFFVDHSFHSCHSNTPWWWSTLEIIFLYISFFAIWSSLKDVSSHVVKSFFWTNWALLVLVISNEYFHWLSLPEYAIYGPAFFLLLGHLYRLKFCKCQTQDHNK